jgi:hypothetical protein
MGGYGAKLPVTGMAVLTVGGMQVVTPWIALAGAAAVTGGFLLLRLVRPSRTHQ